MPTNTSKVLNKLNALVHPQETFSKPKPPPKNAAGETFRIVHEPDRKLLKIPLWEIPRTDAEYRAAIRKMKMQDEPRAEGEPPPPPQYTTRASPTGVDDDDDDDVRTAAINRRSITTPPSSVRYPAGYATKKRTASEGEGLRAPRRLSQRAMIPITPRARRGEQTPRSRVMDAPNASVAISTAVTPTTTTTTRTVCEGDQDVVDAPIGRGRRTRPRRDTDSTITDDTDGYAAAHDDDEMRSRAETLSARWSGFTQGAEGLPDVGVMSECYVCQEACRSGGPLCSDCKDLFQPLQELFESSDSEYEEEQDETPYQPSTPSPAFPVTPPRSEGREDSISTQGEVKGDSVIKNWSEWSEWSEWADLSEPSPSTQRTLSQAKPSPPPRPEGCEDSISSHGEAKGDSAVKNWSEWSEWSEWGELSAQPSSSQPHTPLRAGPASRSSSISPTPHVARQLKVFPHQNIRKVSVNVPARSNNTTTTTNDHTREDQQSALYHIQQDMRLREPLTPGVDPGRQGRDAIRVSRVHSGEVRLVDDSDNNPRKGARNSQPRRRSSLANWFRYSGKETEDGRYSSDRDGPVSPMANSKLFKSFRNRRSARSSTYDRIFSIYNTYCDQAEDGADDGMF